jgi:SHS family sialic acid transporter-like MFS transporter
MAAELAARSRWAVLTATFTALLFDGVELGLMPVASLSVTENLLGEAYTPQQGGDWFARLTAALMLGAALGGIALGNLGDRIGRCRALGGSVLLYSIFAGLGGWAETMEQMLVLRFLVGLGVGGVWPNAVALAAECWPRTSRPIVAGLLGAALNFGILLLSQVARFWPITPDSWRWLFYLAGAPAILGLLILFRLPESPLWLSSRNRTAKGTKTPLLQLLHPPLLSRTLVGILLGTIPMLGAWAASKWMIPWADQVGGVEQAGYKAITQGWWATGAVIGSFFGAQVAARLGRRPAYALMSVGAFVLTAIMFLGTAPLQPGFLPIVLAQGFVATLFFGWLPLYLPELFPTAVRATGSGLAYNVGRFATAAGVLMAGMLFAALGGDYPRVGVLCGSVYLVGCAAIWLAPDTSRSDLGSEHQT